MRQSTSRRGAIFSQAPVSEALENINLLWFGFLLIVLSLFIGFGLIFSVLFLPI